MSRHTQPRSKPKQIAEFNKRLEARLLEFGFRRRPSSSYQFAGMTTFGLVQVSLSNFGDTSYTVFIQFDDHIRTASELGTGSSGKWNYHSDIRGGWRAALDEFTKQHLNRLTFVAWPTAVQRVRLVRAKLQQLVSLQLDGLQAYPWKTRENYETRRKWAALVWHHRNDRWRLRPNEPTPVQIVLPTLRVQGDNLISNLRGSCVAENDAATAS